MASYIEFPDPTTWGDDAAPVHAGLLVDLLRRNMIELGAASPCSVACQHNNDYTAGPQTTTTAYNDNAILHRFPWTFLRTAPGGLLRRLTIDVWASTSANTATLQAVIMSAYRVPAVPPVEPDLAVSTGVGAVTSTPAYHSLVLQPTEGQGAWQSIGAPPDGDAGGGLQYWSTYVLIRGKMEAAGTLTVSRLTYSEV